MSVDYENLATVVRAECGLFRAWADTLGQRAAGNSLRAIAERLEDALDEASDNETEDGDGTTS